MDLITLTAGRYTAKFISLGATLTSFTYKGDDGHVIETVLGFDDLAEYERGYGYMGATVGRFANRIAAGRFTLDGKQYQLELNDGENHLHGGIAGFDRREWDVAASDNEVTFSRVSPDGESCYPGTLNVSITYTLTEDGTLALHYHAKTDEPTIVNLTNHAFFNLNGVGTDTAGTIPNITNHKAQIHASHVLAVDGLIPNGKLIDVTGTAFDLRDGKVIADGMASGEPAITAQMGYDHCFVPNGEGFREVARVSSPETGLTLICSTDLPGLQLYTGNMMNGAFVGRGGVCYVQHGGLCLESQLFPDAINHPEFKQPVLRPGEVFETLTTYKLIKE